MRHSQLPCYIFSASEPCGASCAIHAWRREQRQEIDRRSPVAKLFRRQPRAGLKGGGQHVTAQVVRNWVGDSKGGQAERRYNGIKF